MDEQKFKQVFFPIAYEAEKKTKENGNLFAYYTTADVAFQILKNKRIWMRSTMTMNDYMEIEYGRDLLLAAIDGVPGSELREAVNACHPGLWEETWQHVRSWLPGFKYDTFITCVSEHDATVENDIGRLSMWRAYGGKTGVALIINGSVFDLQTDALGVYSSPVSYFNKEQFNKAVLDVAKGVKANADFVTNLPREVVKDALFVMCRFSVLCTKHPGFAEEKEWRIVASPAMHKLSLLEFEIATVRNVPQRILKIPLKDFPDYNIAGLEIPKLINRVIIGPCEFPHVTAGAMCTALSDAGISDPTSLVFQSNIPLRHA